MLLYEKQMCVPTRDGMLYVCTCAIASACLFRPKGNKARTVVISSVRKLIHGRETEEETRNLHSPNAIAVRHDINQVTDSIFTASEISVIIRNEKIAHC